MIVIEMRIKWKTRKSPRIQNRTKKFSSVNVGDGLMSDAVALPKSALFIVDAIYP